MVYQSHAIGFCSYGGAVFVGSDEFYTLSTPRRHRANLGNNLMNKRRELWPQSMRLPEKAACLAVIRGYPQSTELPA